MKSRDITAIACASRGSARRMVMARGVMAALCHDPGCTDRAKGGRQQGKGRQAMATIDNTADLVANIGDEVKSRSANAAAAKLEHFGGASIAAALSRVSPAFAQDILDALPADARERALGAASSELARQWQINARYPKDSIGRMMEPVAAAYPPQQSVGETIERLRELVKTSFITYVYVVDAELRLQGIVTMRDLLFSDHRTPLRDVMLRDPFALAANLGLMDAMKLVLDRHYPVYPVVDDEKRLVGLVRGQSMFEAQAIEISMQAGTMVGLEKEERLSTPVLRSLTMRHPWLQLNLLTAFLAAAVVGYFQDTLDRLVILALFLPVLAGQSGNTGCQALAVTLRGMTLGEMKTGAARPLVGKETWLGMANGAGVGLMAALGMYITAVGQHQEQPFTLAFVVFAAMVFSCIASGLSGVLVPVALKRMGFDPATASSIFLTTATDCVSMGTLLLLATILIR
jgi:magnesium transporter